MEISNPAMRRLSELLKRQFPGETIASGEKYPSDLLPVLSAGQEKPALALMRWGFPREAGGRQVINARAETAAQKPLFKEAFRLHRCILPTSGFYEWAHDGSRAKYLFRLAGDPMLYLAGLYRKDRDGQRFVLLTQAANASVAKIHQRMPVIVLQNDIRAWLNDRDFAIRLVHRPGPELIKIAQ